MSIVWSDEYDADELDGFQVETPLDEDPFDDAEVWLAQQDVPDHTNM